MGAWNNVWQVCRSHRCIPESLFMVLARASLLLSLWLGWPKTISDLMSSSVLICTHQPSHNFPLDKSKSQHTKLLITESWTYYISSASLAMREGTRSWLMNFYVFFQSTKYVRFCGFHRRFRRYKPPELAAAMWAGCPTRPLDAHFTQSAYGFFFSDLFAPIMCVRSSAWHCWVFFCYPISLACTDFLRNDGWKGGLVRRRRSIPLRDQESQNCKWLKRAFEI